MVFFQDLQLFDGQAPVLPYKTQKLTDQEIEIPKIPRSPIELSYWVASNFQGASLEQQS